MFGCSVIGFATCRSTGFVCCAAAGIESRQTASVRIIGTENRMDLNRRVQSMLTRKQLKNKPLC